MDVNTTTLEVHMSEQEIREGKLDQLDLPDEVKVEILKQLEHEMRQASPDMPSLLH